MNSLPSVSIVVPHYNDLDRLGTCLAALAAQDYPAALVEVIVADNATPCDRQDLLDTVAGRASLVFCAEKGAGLARNAGAASASHGLLAFIDSDCVADPGWLRAGVDALSHADLVGGRVEVTVPTRTGLSGAEAFEKVFAFDNRSYVLRQGFSVTANLFTRSDVFAAVGGFRATVSEDMEWCQRAVSAGFRIAYEDRAIVGHPARADWRELVRKWERLQQESLALAAERPGGRLRWLARSWLLLPSIIAHAPRVLRSPALASNTDRVRALATLVRIRLWRFGHAQRIGFRKR